MSVETHQLENPQQLQDAFQTFNMLSEQLAASYKALEDRVADLSEELATAKSERILQLQEKEKLATRLETLINGLPAGVIVLDGCGVIQQANQKAFEILGEPLYREKWNDVINRVYEAQGNRHEIALKNGKWVTLSTCPLGTEPGQIILITDITETKKLQVHLNQQERLVTMGETAASLAHQIRTPLSSAILYTSNLKRATLSDEERHKTTEKIVARLRHLESLIDDMLMYARGVDMENSAFPVTAFLNELHQIIETHLVASKTNFKVFSEVDETVRLQGNRQMLLSALINIMVNAIQSMGEQGSVIVRVNLTASGEVLLQIQDTGPGINKDLIDKIFEPFFTTRSEGTGLGLAVVRAVIHAHGGDVWVENVKPKGALFNIRLPIAETQSAVEDTQKIA